MSAATRSLQCTSRVALLVLCLGTLAACENFDFPGVYRIDVPQGNVFTEEMVGQLELGMTQKQVRYIMGTPLIQDSFNLERWDYSFSIRNGRKILEQRQLTLLFDGENLVDMNGDFVSAAQLSNNLESAEPAPEPESDLAPDEVATEDSTAEGA